MTTTDAVRSIEEQARAGLAAATDERALEAWRTAVLGRSGSLTGVLRSLGELAPEARRELGAAANRVKTEFEAALEVRREALRQAAHASAVTTGALDVTLPGRPLHRGRYHPLTLTLREILATFEHMGFATIEGPEIENDSYNFEALRIPADHPARDMWDTFWLESQATAEGEWEGAGGLLLRTHTSPMQARYMETHQPPIRIAVPGRCYRYEATDATHEWMLQQVELLVVDEGVSMADLKGTLQEFARALFGPERRVMMRNSYFPFVEPGVEIAVDCFACAGSNPSCPVCRGSGWLEIMGAGMVHPEILAGMGYDAERYTGFAAGMGVERIAMLKYGIEDIRNFYQNDLRFLRQF
ncbi:MAG: phenylalanine--tRNA ligase subunit alpha [Dehalococcoidia bacterium]|nr:phenylalanine--tRNA ligase subunit alpha [Dehalococcoidia bacterium]